jgi:hypothetical protein
MVPPRVERSGIVRGGATLIDKDSHGRTDHLGLVLADFHAVMPALSDQVVSERWRADRPRAVLNAGSQSRRWAFEDELALELSERTRDFPVEPPGRRPGIEAVRANTSDTPTTSGCSTIAARWRSVRPSRSSRDTTATSISRQSHRTSNSSKPDAGRPRR